jgi:5-methylcytosine-specific restriction endonuclease McrA
MFGFILELLNQEGHVAFFELQKGGRKANNAQKEKRCLAWKRSRASKREREREVAKVAKQPTRERQCMSCGRKFNSRKTARKHKCSKAKVVRTQEVAAEGSASRSVPPALLVKPAALPTPTAPTTPSNSNVIPAVTEDLWPPTRPGYTWVMALQNPSHRQQVLKRRQSRSCAGLSISPLKVL